MLSETEQKILASLSETVKALDTFNNEDYRLSRNGLVEARSRYQQATEKAFAGVSIPGILQPEWQHFVQAGEELISKHKSPTYPREHDRCLYCQQTLDTSAIELLNKYRDYCNSELRTAVTNAETQVKKAIQGILNIKVSEQAEKLKQQGLFGGDVGALASIQAVLASAQELQNAVMQELTYADETLRKELDKARSLLDNRLKQLGEISATLRKRVEDRNTALKDAETSLTDITSRIRLQEILPAIEEYVKSAQWVNKAEIVRSRFQGIFKSLTETSKTASEKLLNQDFERRFIQECSRLRAPKVKLEFPGSKGQVTRRKTVIANHQLSEILSEGEQKVIALADFLSEVGLKPKAPVIFDDPITSLDYRRMTDLVARLVQLSEERQVIIFTHNIWFATEILSHFEKKTERCSYYDIRSDTKQLGIVTKGTHPRADTITSLKSRINELIRNAEKATGETQAALVEKGYEVLRNYCEVAVEMEFLQGVTQRFQPNVMMTRLSSIKFDRLQEAVGAISPIFERCCRYIASHSQPLETLNVRPGIAELKQDWATVQNAREKYLKG